MVLYLNRDGTPVRLLVGEVGLAAGAAAGVVVLLCVFGGRDDGELDDCGLGGRGGGGRCGRDVEAAPLRAARGALGGLPPRAQHGHALHCPAKKLQQELLKIHKQNLTK